MRKEALLVLFVVMTANTPLAAYADDVLHAGKVEESLVVLTVDSATPLQTLKVSGKPVGTYWVSSGLQTGENAQRILVTHVAADTTTDCQVHLTFRIESRPDIGRKKKVPLNFRKSDDTTFWKYGSVVFSTHGALSGNQRILVHVSGNLDHCQ